MTGSVYKLRLHRFTLVLICCGLFIVLLKSTSWLIRTGEQHSRLTQREAFAQNEAQLISASLSPLLQTQTPDNARIGQLLTTFTDNRDILDASVYSDTGVLIASAGDNIPLRQRLGISGEAFASQSSRQIVQAILGDSDPAGFLRLTLSIAPDTQSSRLVNHLISLIQTFLVISLILGVVLARTLRRYPSPAKSLE